MKKTILILLVVFASLVSSGQMFFGHNHMPDSSLNGLGLLYNWHAVSNVNFAPTDWKVPINSEYQTLSNYLGGDGVSGGELKTTGYTKWNSPNTGATNSSGFYGVGAGLRSATGFFDLLQFGYLWCSNQSDASNGYYFKLEYNTDNGSVNVNQKEYGYSVRLLYTGAGTPTTVTDYDGNVYNVVHIGTQYWTVQNWKCKHLTNGDDIPEVTSNAAWSILSTGAWCYYENNPLYK